MRNMPASNGNKNWKFYCDCATMVVKDVLMTQHEKTKNIKCSKCSKMLNTK